MQDPNRGTRATREDYYWYSRDRGATHEDALRFADQATRPPQARRQEPQRPATPPKQPSALGGITRALAQGATRDVAASYAGGASWLTGGGDSAIGRYLERAEQNIEGDYEPQTGAERAARVVGRIGGEIGTAIALGGGLVRAATAVPQLSRVAGALQSTSRLKRGAAYAATQAPLDVLMGSRDEAPLLLPESFGRPGAMAENVALTGVAGALFAPVRQARAGRQAADEAAAGARPAADAAAPPPAAAQPAPAGRPRPAPAPEVQAPPAAARAPRADAAEDVAQNVQGLLEGPLATFRAKEGVLRFGFEDTADGAAWILARGGKQTRGRAQAQRYLESLGLSEDQIKQYASNVGKSLRREAKEFSFDPAEKGQTVFYYVPKIGSPSVPAAAAGPVAPVRPVRAMDEVVPQAKPVGTAGYQAGLDETETAFRQAIPEETIRRGSQAAVRVAEGAPTPSATYAIVDASQITPSHSPSTFAWNDLYPTAMQQRDYSKVKAYQDAVNKRAMELNSDFLTDPTRSLQDGPPLVSRTGLVIAGNDRSMSLMRAAEVAPERYADYVRRLEDVAESFGLSADAVRSVQNPILVRVADEPFSVRQMRDINRASDIAETKGFSGWAEARSRAQVLKEADQALEHFSRTIDPEQTIREYLTTADGRRFVDILTDEGVIPKDRLAGLLSEADTSVLSDSGRDFVAKLMASSALTRAADMPPSVLNKMEHATPHIAKMKGVPGWDVGPVVDEAADILIRARSAGLSLDAFLGQRPLFDEQTYSEAAQAVARFIEGSNKKGVTEAFRRMSRFADEARGREASGAVDMFGETITAGTLDDALSSVFRAPGAAPVAAAPVAAAPAAARTASTADDLNRAAEFFARSGVGDDVSQKRLTELMADLAENDTSAFNALVESGMGVQDMVARASALRSPRGATGAVDFQLPKELQRMSPNYRSHAVKFDSDLDRSAYIIANDRTKGRESKAAGRIKEAIIRAGLTVDDVVAHGRDNVIPALKEAAKNASEGDMIVINALPYGVRPSVGAPEIASGVAGAALGALAGATTPSDEDTQYAIPGAILGGALGGAFGRQAGRQIASDAGIIARGERRAPRADRFIEEATRREGTAAGLRSSIAANVSRFRYNVVEETHPVLLLAKKTLGNKAARKLDGMIARFAGAGQESMQYMRDNYDEFFRRFTEEQRRQIADFAVDRRAWESGLSIGKTPEALAQSYEAGMANPVLREGSDMLMGYFRRLLDMRYRAGLIPDADYQRILQSDDYYVPFAAEFAAESRRKAAKQAAGWNVRETGVGRMDREAIRDWQIQDPLEVLVEATVAAHRDVAKKRAFNIIARAIDKAAVDLEQGRSQIGKFIYRVDPSSRSKFEANRFNAINKRGERVTYEVRDEELFQAIAQQNKMSQNFAIEMLRDLARFKRAAIVLEPSFSLMQSIRDVPFYVAQRQDFQRGIREAGMGAAAGALAGSATEEDNMLAGALIGMGLGASARPVVELMGSLKNILGNDETYRQWLRMGGSSEGLRVRDPKDAREILRRLAADGVDLRDVVTPKRWVDALSFIAGAGEQMPRLAKYKELVARGVDPSIAIRESQAVTVRFASKGASPLLKEINAITPFFNAKIQGWDKLVQMAKDPKQRVMAGMVLLAPTVGLFMINKDNPEYWDRPQWEKDNFWLVPKPEGGFYRVPKPFELGYAFASIPERYMSFLAETGEMESAAPRRNVTGAQALARGAGTFLLDPVQQTAPMPTALEIPLSQAMNYDFFRRRQLVPQYYERIQSGEQALPYTGALPRFIGRATQVGGLSGISPIRAEKFLTDIGGTGYRRLSEGVLDPAFRSAGMDAPVQRARDMGLGPELTRLTGLSRFVTRDYDATQVETDARDRLRRMDVVHQTLQMKINQRRPVEEIRAYRERHREELAARARLNDLRIRLDRITAERRDIMRRTDITPEQRDARMDRLKSQADLISRRVVEHGAT